MSLRISKRMETPSLERVRLLYYKNILSFQTVRMNEVKCTAQKQANWFDVILGIDRTIVANGSMHVFFWEFAKAIISPEHVNAYYKGYVFCLGTIVQWLGR